MANVVSQQAQSGHYAVIPTQAGTATVILKAGGGGGGDAFNDSSAQAAGGGGGGGGGSLVATVELQANTPYLCIVGAGGVVVPADASGGVKSQDGGDTAFFQGTGELYRAYGGHGATQAFYGLAGNGGCGGAPDGGGGGGGGQSDSGFGPSAGPGAGGAGAPHGGAGGAGGSCNGYIGAAGGGGGAGGCSAAGGQGGNGGRSGVPAPGQGGQAGAFEPPLSAGSGLTGRQGNLNGVGCGGGGGGASRTSVTDISGQGGMGYGLDSAQPWPSATSGNDGLISISFVEALMFVPVPMVKNVAPLAATSGTPITISGTGFSTTPSDNTLLIGDSFSATATTATATELTFVLPPYLGSPISTPVVVRVGDLPSHPSTQSLSLYPQAEIRFAYPSPIGIGAALQISGANFGPSNSDNEVFFAGGVSAVPTQSATGSLTVNVPAGAEDGPIYVQAYGLAGTPSPEPVVIQPIPTITQAPAAVAMRGTFTIQGTGFSTSPQANLVDFTGNGAVATPISATELQVTVPYHAVSGPMRVVINGVPSSTVVILIKSTPALPSLAPLTIQAGDVLTLTGGEYSAYNTYTVTFSGAGGTPQPAIYVSPNELRVLVPAGARSGTVQLSTNGLSVESTQSLTIQNADVTYQPIEGSYDQLYTIGWNGTTFVALGHNGINASSPDGQRWTPGPQIDPEHNASLQSIAYGASGPFVAVGATPRIYWNSNGLGPWNGANVPPPGPVWAGLAWGNKTFVAVGHYSEPTPPYKTTYYYGISPDGITWTLGNEWEASNVRGVMWDGGQFICFASSHSILTSPDGIRWTKQVISQDQDSWNDLIASDALSLYVAVGQQVVSTSPDGVTWTRQTSLALGDLNAVACAGSRLVAVGGKGNVQTSVDGKNWVSITVPAIAQLQLYAVVAVSRFEFMAIAASGAVRIRFSDVMHPWQEGEY